MKIQITKINSKKLKQRIKEHGVIWNVLETTNSSICFNGQPGMKIESVETGHVRWIPLSSGEITFKTISDNNTPHPQPDIDICSECGEHTEFDEHGSACCGAGPYDTDPDIDMER